MTSTEKQGVYTRVMAQELEPESVAPMNSGNCGIGHYRARSALSTGSTSSWRTHRITAYLNAQPPEVRITS